VSFRSWSPAIPCRNPSLIGPLLNRANCIFGHHANGSFKGLDQPKFRESSPLKVIGAAYPRDGQLQPVSRGRAGQQHHAAPASANDMLSMTRYLEEHRWPGSVSRKGWRFSVRKRRQVLTPDRAETAPCPKAFGRGCRRVTVPKELQSSRA